jgi:cell division protein FtsZ
MTNLHLSIPTEISDLKPRITVVGVGGAGGNAVNNMVATGLAGVEFIACNTDAQALHLSLAPRRIQLGKTATRGLGAGARPDIGRKAAEEAMEEILEHLADSHMVFVTAGMGGGTGTGAAPVIAKAAREKGILTIGVITKPFHFEGTNRMRLADSGIAELQKFVDTLLIIPNQNLFRVANEKTTFADAFRMADGVLCAGVRGVTDLMIKPGLINLDFADIRTVMGEMGKAMMGTGEATGEKRAIDAAEAAISNPLLDDVSMKGAKGVLISITGGSDMTLFEVDEAANRIREEVDPEANIVFGSTFDEDLQGRMRISVVATGIDAEISRIANERVDATQPAKPQRVAEPIEVPSTLHAQNQPQPQPPPDLFPKAQPGDILIPNYAAGLAAGPGRGNTDHGDRHFIAPPPVAPAARNPTESDPLMRIRAEERMHEPPKTHRSSLNPFTWLRGSRQEQEAQARTEANLAQMRANQGAPPAPRATGHGTETASRGQGLSDEDYLEIPAFLRRQAN